MSSMAFASSMLALKSMQEVTGDDAGARRSVDLTRGSIDQDRGRASGEFKREGDPPSSPTISAKRPDGIGLTRQNSTSSHPSLSRPIMSSLLNRFKGQEKVDASNPRASILVDVEADEDDHEAMNAFRVQKLLILQHLLEQEAVPGPPADSVKGGDEVGEGVTVGEEEIALAAEVDAAAGHVEDVLNDVEETVVMEDAPAVSAENEGADEDSVTPPEVAVVPPSLDPEVAMALPNRTDEAIAVPQSSSDLNAIAAEPSPSSEGRVEVQEETIEPQQDKHPIISTSLTGLTESGVPENAEPLIAETAEEAAPLFLGTIHKVEKDDTKELPLESLESLAQTAHMAFIGLDPVKQEQPPSTISPAPEEREEGEEDKQDGPASSIEFDLADYEGDDEPTSPRDIEPTNPITPSISVSRPIPTWLSVPHDRQDMDVEQATLLTAKFPSLKRVVKRKQSTLTVNHLISDLDLCIAGLEAGGGLPDLDSDFLEGYGVEDVEEIVVIDEGEDLVDMWGGEEVEVTSVPRVDDSFLVSKSTVTASVTNMDELAEKRRGSPPSSLPSSGGSKEPGSGVAEIPPRISNGTPESFTEEGEETPNPAPSSTTPDSPTTQKSKTVIVRMVNGTVTEVSALPKALKMMGLTPGQKKSPPTLTSVPERSSMKKGAMLRGGAAAAFLLADTTSGSGTSEKKQSRKREGPKALRVMGIVEDGGITSAGMTPSSALSPRSATVSNKLPYLIAEEQIEDEDDNDSIFAPVSGGKPITGRAHSTPSKALRTLGILPTPDLSPASTTATPSSSPSDPSLSGSPKPAPDAPSNRSRSVDRKLAMPISSSMALGVPLSEGEPRRSFHVDRRGSIPSSEGSSTGRGRGFRPSMDVSRSLLTVQSVLTSPEHPPSKVGNLHKTSVKGRGLFRAWRKRYFVLAPTWGRLMVFRSGDSGEKCEGWIRVTGGMDVSVGYGVTFKGRASIQVVAEGKEQGGGEKVVWNLCAEDEGERDEWVRALKEAVEIVKKQFTEPSDRATEPLQRRPSSTLPRTFTNSPSLDLRSRSTPTPQRATSSLPATSQADVQSLHRSAHIDSDPPLPGRTDVSASPAAPPPRAHSSGGSLHGKTRSLGGASTEVKGSTFRGPPLQPFGAPGGGGGFAVGGLPFPMMPMMPPPPAGMDPATAAAAAMMAGMYDPRMSMMFPPNAAGMFGGPDLFSGVGFPGAVTFPGVVGYPDETAQPTHLEGGIPMGASPAFATGGYNPGMMMALRQQQQQQQQQHPSMMMMMEPAGGTAPPPSQSSTSTAALLLLETQIRNTQAKQTQLLAAQKILMAKAVAESTTTDGPPSPPVSLPSSSSSVKRNPVRTSSIGPGTRPLAGGGVGHGVRGSSMHRGGRRGVGGGARGSAGVVVPSCWPEGSRSGRERGLREGEEGDGR
ncbi:hypothetical protein HDU67_007164 [Dinochytrium kinnereticum]|nr:hypothetical protein HDU67_007164 [Dinochytrium kinnereticum]